ncbi:MAG: hypothetical protein ACMG51_10225, partial [Ginsengibacter sp.]
MSDSIDDLSSPVAAPAPAAPAAPGGAQDIDALSAPVGASGNAPGGQPAAPGDPNADQNDRTKAREDAAHPLVRFEEAVNSADPKNNIFVQAFNILKTNADVQKLWNESYDNGVENGSITEGRYEWMQGQTANMYKEWQAERPQIPVIDNVDWKKAVQDPAGFMGDLGSGLHKLYSSIVADPATAAGDFVKGAIEDPEMMLPITKPFGLAEKAAAGIKSAKIAGAVETGG